MDENRCSTLMDGEIRNRRALHNGGDGSGYYSVFESSQCLLRTHLVVMGGCEKCNGFKVNWA
jgi:hypothetical protein